MKKINPSKTASLVIGGLTVIFTGLILWSLFAPGKGSPDLGGVPGTGTPRAGPPGTQNSSGPGGGAGRQGAGNRQGAASRVTAAVRAVPVVPGTIETSVALNGDVLAGTQVSLYPQAAGKLTETRVQVGDTVSRGQVLAMVDPSRPGEFYSLSPVVSTIPGTVLQKNLNPGDTVSTQTAVYVIGDLSSLAVETFVPERFSTAIKPGLGAQVSFEAMRGETFPAAVSEISPVLDPASRTLRIRLRFSGPADRRIKAGMFASVSLVTGSRRNVPMIPRSSAINTYGSWIVFVVRSDSTAERREIELGMENEEAVEVIRGLSEGELVVSAGQNFLSNNDPVRVVN